MKSITGIGLSDVQAVYGGPEGKLWELIMGEQIHIGGYRDLLSARGCEVLAAEDTGLFAPYTDLYIDMIERQLTYDALKIIGFDVALMGSLGAGMHFMRELARAGKIAQGRFIARKKG